MAENETLVPRSQAFRLLTTGFEWEAGLFVEAYKELTARFGRDVAKEILASSMRRAGFELGEEARGMVDTGGPRGMARAWDIVYGMGSKEAEQLDDDRFVFRVNDCAAFNLFRRRGLSDEEIGFICDAYCVADVGFADGFGKEMYFQHTSRLMKGDECCRWEYSTFRQEPSDAAVQESPGTV